MTKKPPSKWDEAKRIAHGFAELGRTIKKIAATPGQVARKAKQDAKFRKPSDPRIYRDFEKEYYERKSRNDESETDQG